MSVSPIPGSHPVLACADQIAAALDEVADTDPGYLRTTEKEAALLALTQVVSRVEELRTRVLAVADDVAAAHGARHAGAWVAHQTRATRASGHADQRLAEALRAHDPVRQALADGDVRRDQAVEIVRAVDALPSTVSVPSTDSCPTPSVPGADQHDGLHAADVVVGIQLRGKARAHLLALAADHDAAGLRRLGKRILDVVAPELGQAHEAAILTAEEARAARTASFTMVDDGHGRCHGRFVIPTLAGAMLKQHLLALANPRRHDEETLKDDAGQWRPMPERLGAAFNEYIERYPSDHTPSAGGIAATVVVTMTVEALTGGLAAASLSNGTPISASQARRLACEAGIIPAVLGTHSQPLDLGRKTRLHTQPQRIALALRDRGCTAQGCDHPPAACHAHHDHPWSRGGSTTVDTGRLLCPHHHRLAHHPDYNTKTDANNSVSFHRRT